MLHTTSNPTGATLNGKLMNGGSSVMTGTGNSTGNSSSSMIMTSNTVTGSGAGSVTATTTAAVSAVNAGPLDAATKRAEREHLRAIIAQWNANRLDLFEISEPNEDLEFYGVMRFYFQDAGQKVATKCLRISSSASTHDVIANLIEKFRPDIRMLSVPEYALYEIHENGEERKLAESEMPLLVQLNWHKDDREGRFLLRRMDEKTNLSGISNTETSGNLLNRKLSKREKKEKKKREKKEKAAKGSDKGGKDSLAEKLYTELPETSFTRSISNPEAVMRRRRQQKLEKKLQQFSAEGGPEAGGTLRIFGESINQDVPYKTILLSTQDTAAFAVKEILEKYGKDKEEPANYCLVQIIVPYANGTSVPSNQQQQQTTSAETSSGANGAAPLAENAVSPISSSGPVREYILDDDDCPLIIERSHLKSRGVLTFHIRRRPPDFQPRKRKKKSPGSVSVGGQQPHPQSFDGNSSVASDLGAGIITKQQQQQQPVHGEETATSALLNGGAKLMPYIVEVNADGSELTLGRSSNIPGTTGPRRHFLFMNVTEVGAADAAMLAGGGTGSQGPLGGRAPPPSSQASNSNSNRSSNSIQLLGPNILPRHCIITHSEGLITVTPCSREAETFVNGTRITETTILKHGMLVRFGKLHTFKFVDEGDALRRQLSTSTGAIIGQHFAAQAAAASEGNSSSAALNAMTANASYETTFDAEGKVETAPASVHPSFSSGSLQRNSHSNFQQQHQHQLHQPFPTGSLPRSASANSGGGGGGYHPHHHSHHHHQSSLDAQQQQQQQQLMPPPSGTPTSMMMQLRSAQAAGQQQTGPAGSNTMRKPGAGGGDNILPAILEVWEEIEPLFLNLLITRADPNAIQFKLAIAYTLYMVTRFRASTYFKPEIVPNQRATLLIGFCIRYAKLIHKEIGERQRAQAHLAFWLANSSELLHFLKNDRHLAAFTLESQEILADAVQYAFGGLVRCQQAELKEALAAFPDDQRSPGNSNSNNTSSTTSTSTARVLAVLSNSMALLRRFRVNAALTIQLFSQLFHYINMWLFNRVLGTAESNLCSRPYGDRLKAALLEIEAWAEKQGLELAAECHLSRIAQTAQFLQAPKAGRSAEELTALVDKFYKLNSLQLRALFERYQPTGAEELANAAFVRLLRDPALIEAVVKQARVATDELILKEGREVRLEEEIDLQLPFLLPEDGYSCDIVVGIPATLADFVQSLVAARVAKLTVQPTASGYWTIYFINFMPEVAAQAAAAHHQHQQQQHPHHYHQAMNSQETSTQSSSGTVTTTSTSGHFSGGDQSSGGSGGGGSVGSKSSTLVATPLAGPGYPLATSASAGQLMLNGQFRPAPGMSPLPSPQRSISGMVPGSPGFGAMPPPHAAMFNSFNGMRTMPEPEVQIIKLQKINNGIGLSIVAAQGTHQPVQGIYIKSVVKDGAADLDGRLKAGDQLLKVDGHSLIGIDQENAAKLMTNTGPVVTLEVAKQGAVFHGLSGLLKEQSASTTSLLKQATMRPRFANVPNASQAAADQYGAIRAMSNQNLMGHPRMGMTLPGGPNFNPGAYNTLPMGSSSSSLYSQQQMQQQAGLARGGPGGPQMLGHNSSSHSSLLLQHHHQQQQQQLLLQQQQQLPMRSDSQLSFNSKPGGGGLYEERHYQNIQLYQLNPRTGSPIGPGGPVAGNPAAARLAQMGPPLHHGSHSSLQPPQGYDQSMVSSAAPSQLTSVMGRPVSALVTSREQEQMPIFGNQQQQANYGQLQSPRGNSAAATSLEVRQRDLMRQEAKMEEIREELRRREDRGPNGNNNSNAAISRQVLGASSSLASTSSSQVRPSMMASSSTSSGTLLRTSGLQQQQQYPSAGNRLGSGSSGGGQPPAPAPKPNRPASAAFSSSGSLQQQQQPGSLSSSSSSQQLPMATQVSYRYGPSGYPQSSATASNNNNNTTTSTTKSMQSSGAATLALGRTSGGKTSPSPWEREEKEKEQALKNEDSRERSREEEIRHLESLPYRNPKNEDRLRALLTERDFQRRAAEEAAKNGGDDYYGEGEYEDEEATARMLDRAEKRERMIALQADIERTRQRRLEGRYGGGNDLMEARAGSDGKLNKTLEEQEERLKMLRLEEEAAQQAEERLLQEAAKRRQDDESVPNHHHRAPPLVSKGILKSSGSVFNNNNNLDNDLPPPLPNSPPPVESANQRLDRLLLSTAHSKSASDDSTQLPPLTMVAPRGGVLKNGTAYNGSGGGSGGNHDQSSSNSSSNAAPKKVSWNTKTTVVVTPEDGEDDEEDDEDEGDRSDNDEQEGNRQHRRVENTTNKNNNNNNEEEDDDEEFYGGNGGAQNNGLGNGRGGGGGGDDLEETFSLQDIEEALVIGGDGSQGGQGNQTGGANTSSSGSAAQDDTTAGDMLTANSYDEEWHTKYVSSGHTSGVIGTQEIYNDPRQRIEAARRLAATNASQSALAGDKVPEKLSFAEKMKMFAKTSGAAAEDENNQINSGRGGPGGVTVSGTGKGAAAAASSNNSKSSSSVNQRTTVVTTNGGER